MENNLMENNLMEENDSIATKIIRVICISISVLISLIPITWFFCIRVFEQYERGVVFRLGKVLKRPKGPGIFYFLPFVDTYSNVDLRIRTIDVMPQEMMTKDSVTCTVNAVIYYRIRDPIKSIIQVEDSRTATAQFAQTTLRSVVGENELDALLSKRDQINTRITEILEKATDSWGVHVTAVEIKDVVLPKDMQRAMASQAEAERERRAKVISAEGEQQAAATLLKAAQKMTRNDTSMQLRYLQTLTQISTEKNQTIVFPLPVEALQRFLKPQISQKEKKDLVASDMS